MISLHIGRRCRGDSLAASGCLWEPRGAGHVWTCVGEDRGLDESGGVDAAQPQMCRVARCGLCRISCVWLTDPARAVVWSMWLHSGVCGCFGFFNACSACVGRKIIGSLVRNDVPLWLTISSGVVDLFSDHYSWQMICAPTIHANDVFSIPFAWHIGAL